jgi:hypothetical protein
VLQSKDLESGTEEAEDILLETEWYMHNNTFTSVFYSDFKTGLLPISEFPKRPHSVWFYCFLVLHEMIE